MASGVGVVTTNLGIEGLEAKNNIHVLASEHEDEMADLVLDLIHDHSLYRKLTLNARKLVEEKYEWNVVFKNFDKVLEAVKA